MIDNKKTISEMSDDEKEKIFENPFLELFGISELVKQNREKDEKDNERKSKCIAKILALIKKDGDNTDISDIEFLIFETSSLNDYPEGEKKYQEIKIWKELNDMINGKDEINLKIRKEISNCFTRIINHPFSNENTNENKPESNPNLKTQTANFLLLNELGIIDFLKVRYPDILINDNEIGKLLCQIMRYETETEKKSMRTLVRDLRNKPESLKTDKAMNEVNQILVFHKLRELK